MDRQAHRVIVAGGLLVAVLAIVASGAGVFLRGDLTTESFVTVRGETVDTLAGGAYRFNGLAIAAEGVGWDLVTLFVAVPAFLVSLAFVARGSLRGSLAALGFLAYFLYQYAEYAMFLAYGPLFPVYVAAFSLSLCLIVAIAAGLDLSALTAHVSDRFPRRGAMTLGVLMAALLSAMWLPLIVRTMTQTVVDELDGATTLVVQAFDLGLLVPLGLFTVYATFRHRPVGVVLAAVVGIKAMAMGTAIAAMLGVEWLATGVPAAPPMILFGAIAIFGAWLATAVLSSVQAEAGPSGARGMPARRHVAAAP